MKNLKKLSREELRNVAGGRACSIVVQLANGTWETHTGECRAPKFFGNGPYYCETGLGNIALSSNGGVSHCNDY